MILAAMVLPLLLMYCISGILYTFDIKGHIQKKKFDIVLEQPISLALDTFASVTKQYLLAHQLPIPDGDMTLKKRKSSYLFRWGSLKYTVSVKTTKNPNILNMTVRERSLLTQVMRIHRADAGTMLKMIPSILVAGVLLVLLSGMYMALTIPKYRRPVWYSMGLSTAFILILFMTL